MDSVIEVQRQTHEEIEHFERALYRILAKPQTTHEGKLQTEHKASQILDRISARVVTLNSAYEDEEARKTELDLLSSTSNPGDLSEFYKRLGKIQEHYAKYPEAVTSGFDLEIASFLDDDQEQLDDEEYEADDRESLLAAHIHFCYDLNLLKLLLFSSPAKNNTASTWTFTPTILHTTI